MLARLLAVATYLSVCLCLCLSVTGRCSNETDERIELVLGRELPSTYPTLCVKEIRVPSKQGYFPHWNFVPNSGLRNFAIAYRSSKRVID